MPKLIQLNVMCAGCWFVLGVWKWSGRSSLEELMLDIYVRSVCISAANPLTPTVAIWVQLLSILCQTGLSRHL